MEEFLFEEIDLRILKNLVSNQQLALEFVQSQPENIFIGDAADVGKLIVQYIKAYKNVPTKRILLDKAGEELRDKVSYVFQEIDKLEVDPKEFSYEVDQLKQRFVAAKVSEIRDRFTYDLDENDCETTIAQLQFTLKDIDRVRNPVRQTYVQRPIKDYVEEFKSDYLARSKDPNLGRGILTGYSYLDYVCNGIRPGDLALVGAETNQGKSLFLNNIAIQMWMQQNSIITDPDKYTKGYNVLYFSLEMPYEPCFRRTMARLADVPNYGLRDSTLQKSELEAVNQATQFIANFPWQFEIVDIPKGADINTIEERYLEAKTRFNPDVVIVDYLGIMADVQKGDSDWLKLSNISADLHEFARTYNTCVWSAVQLNRLSSAKKTPEPHEIVGLHRFGRSSLIAHHANICLQLETRPDEHLRQDLIYHILKNREGEKGSHTIIKNFAHSSIIDVPYVPPNYDEFGALNGIFNNDDISTKLADILKI